MSYVPDGKKQTFAGFNPTQKQIDAMARVATLQTNLGQTWGAGAIGTGSPNKSFRTTDPISGDIITTIEIGLKGLKSASDDGDIIGLDGTDGAYLIQYQTATHGILYKSEVICVELPTASSNVALDFDLGAVSAADGAYDDDANAGTFHTGGSNVALGTSTVDRVQGTLTNNHYIYLLTGAAHTGASVFTAGRLVIKLHGYNV
tara:strand:+ start:81 stop:689 length:609 start_codon:yes stop_codon:yes gene_type:complete